MVTAAIEGVTGLLLLAVPSLVARLLLGSSLDGAVPLTVAHLTGLALLTLTVACWLARPDDDTRAANGLVTAMAVFTTSEPHSSLSMPALACGLSGIALLASRPAAPRNGCLVRDASA